MVLMAVTLTGTSGNTVDLSGVETVTGGGGFDAVTLTDASGSTG